MAKGPNGERNLCAACGQWFLPYMPDNSTIVPICPPCWENTSLNAKVFAISLARMTARVAALDQTIFEGIDGAILKLVEARAKEMNRHRDN